MERGLSIREIARELDRSPTAVRHWLRRFGLITSRTRGEASPEPVVVRTCPRHGVSEFVRYGAGDRHRCRRCRYEAVTDRRRRVKAILVEEAGGRCELCGYDRFLGALQFHHRDPATKAFNVSLNGHARALDRCREEVRKCALLCANCHAEVEWGAATLPA